MKSATGATNTGTVLVSQRQAAGFTYDFDGNLTSNGPWTLALPSLRLLAAGRTAIS